VDDRVVVLDFGLVRELNSSAATVTADGSVAGTPAYMAPEQIMAQELSAATDWYAFGVMLYEALSGVLPFEGSLVQLLQTKLESDPVPVEQLVPEAPRWLSDLCSALLRRNPVERPSGGQVLALFDAAEPHIPQPRTVTETVHGTETDGSGAPAELFGRTQELKQLHGAFEQAQDGRTVVVHVRGASGAGKSALVEHFLDQLVSQDAEFGSQDLLVLRSRCYELETTPFKALDGVTDAQRRRRTRAGLSGTRTTRCGPAARGEPSTHAGRVAETT
jgi:serine/threonine protein kinase